MTPSLFAALFTALVKSTVLFAAALALLYLLRRSTAAVRHAVCLFALCGAVLLAPSALAPASFGVPMAIKVSAAAAPSGSAQTAPIAWPQVALIVWAAGALLIAARYAIGLVAVRRLVATSHPVTNTAWLDDLRQLDETSGVDLRFAPIDTPLTCDLTRPAILLPLDAEDWSRSHRHAVLLHELAHVQRRDLWSGAAAAVATAVFWFHPLAWILAKRMRQEQECACDDAVLNRGIAPSRYAELLLQSAAANVPAKPLFACAMTGGYAFRSRLVHVLDPSRPRTTRRAALKRIGAVAACSVLAVAVLKPVWADDVHKVGGDVKPPKLIQKVEPKYTEGARDAKVEGTVAMYIVVGTDGRAHDAKIIKSLDPGLDNNALDAVSQWVFKPGTKKGEPVRVAARIEVNFRLK